MNRIPVVCVVGPTASGKTGLAVEIARLCNGEVVSADSMQLYRHMDIGTAKPTEEEKRGIPHHMLDFLEPCESYSVARFVAEASACIEDIHSRGRLPVVCGGTGLYVDSLINAVPFFEQEEPHPLREQLQREYAADKGEALMKELAEKDPEAAAKIHQNNAVKLIRAVEIIRSGRTLTGQRELTEKTQSPYKALYFGIDFEDRDILYSRIEKRVDLMLENGLIEEARRIKEMSDLSKTAAAAIGYKELFDYLDGKTDLKTAANAVKIATRHYAKRQLTWFRRNKSIKWLEGSKSFENMTASVKKELENFGIL